jgi:NAD(P)H-hydrate repair Nnr-like enzyme with NAD(P)H-hydrate dehydratase domain
LLAAAIKSCQKLGAPAPYTYLAGDIGLGDGSRQLYGYLSKNLGKTNFETIAFHYLQPNVDWHNRVLFAAEEMKKRPILIADAGFMYAAKMSGQAGRYDLFTPDIGEMAFLADEKAPHPFYTRGFILHEDNRLPELISRAYEHENASKHLLVKGEKDYVSTHKGIHAIIDRPSEEALEAIGGTGDTLTGMVSALVQCNMDIIEAAAIAAAVNRLAGHYAAATPSTQISEIIRQIPRALEEILDSRKAGLGR